MAGERWLIDTGPLVAYVDAGDPAHHAVATALGGFSGKLYTTAAVVTEAMHLVSEDSRGPGVLAGFLVATRADIAGLTAPPDLQEAVRLMDEYRDTPMEFADATLVVLASRLGVTEIATLDVRGFSTYRAARKKPFRLVLPRRT
jgi:predicted nucleic acid-binding protein